MLPTPAHTTKHFSVAYYSIHLLCTVIAMLFFPPVLFALGFMDSLFNT